jgi:predicted transcriptional regulator with HTH domain
MTRIRFYSYKIFPQSKKIADMFRAVDIVCDTVNTVARVFGGKVIYVGTGEESFQYDDVVEFTNLKEEDKKTILSTYPFASVLSR